PQVARWVASDPPSSLAWLPKALSFAGAALVAISAFLTRELLGPKSERSWITARSIAESLKTEGYIYATGAPPYGELAAAPTRLLDRMAELTASGSEIGALPDAAPDIAT